MWQLEIADRVFDGKPPKTTHASRKEAMDNLYAYVVAHYGEFKPQDVGKIQGGKRSYCYPDGLPGDGVMAIVEPIKT